MAKDSISALLDGECGPEEIDRILDEMQRSPELKATWSRLCLGRDARDGVSVRKSQPCICAGVMSRLDAQEPKASAKVVPLTAPPRRRAWWMPAAGLAAAASVAAVAVVVNLPSPDNPGGAPGFVPDALETIVAPSKSGTPGSLQLVSAAPDETQRSAQDDELRRYLIEHSNTLADRGMGATLSYARFTAHSVGDSAIQPVSFGASGDQP